MMRWLYFFLLGAAAGSLLDGIHTHSGMTAYTTVWFWRMAWWTPPLFGAAVVAMAANHLALDRRAPRPTPSAANVTGAIAVFVAAYFASGYLPVGNLTKALLLALIAVGAWLAFDRSWQGAVLALATAISGPFVEIVLTHFGTFQHLRPDLWGVPAWLCGLYATASVAVGNLARRTATPGLRDRGNE